MANITKYNVYLSDAQQNKLELLAAITGRDIEEIVNNAVYGYRAIANPFATDDEPPADQHEILFNISDKEADQIMKVLHLDDYDYLDDYAKYLLLNDLHSRIKKAVGNDLEEQLLCDTSG